MRIIKRPDTIPFIDVPLGGFFEFDGELYLKTPESYDENDGDTGNCVIIDEVGNMKDYFHYIDPRYLVKYYPNATIMLDGVEE